VVGDRTPDDLATVDVSVDELRQLVDAKRLPRWVIGKGSYGPGYVAVRALMRDKALATVCEEAACPNISRCWSRGTATFMIAGERCTEAAAAMGLRFVVVTAVARDDMPDGGAGHFVSTIRALRDRLPEAKVEVLIPDLRGNWDALDAIIEAAPDVLNHNTETVPRLYKRVRPGARYERTLELLERTAAAGLRAKSGIMVGLGERLPEVTQVFTDLASVGCELVTVGQYLRPSAEHLPVERYYAPAEYPALAELGRAVGLGHVEAGPLVRSSFEADRVAEELPLPLGR
jgi:lipoyl synthase